MIQYSLIVLFCAAALLGPGKGYATTTIDGQSNITIDGQTFTDGSGTCLVINDSSNITITNSTFTDCNGQGIQVEGTSSNITITHNTFENVQTGAYFNGPTGNGFVFSYNRCTNMKGPIARGQCVQMNGVSGTGHRIQNNYSIAYRGANCYGGPTISITVCTRKPEDHINIFNSGGAVGDYLQITGNYLEGGGPSTSGAGIVVGDNGGSYINVENNFLLNTGSQGIAVAGGSFIVVNNNRIYGRRTDVSNIGLSAYNSTAACSDITITNNVVWFYKRTGAVATYYMPTSGGVECTNRTYTNNTNDDDVFFRSSAAPRTAR